MKKIINLLKINTIIIIILVLIIPIIFYFNVNSGFKNLQPTDFYAIKSENKAGYFKMKYASKPLINDESVRVFIKEAIVNIYNYNSTNYNERDRYSRFFTNKGLEKFENGFISKTEDSVNKGIQIFRTIVLEDPVMLRKNEALNIWQFYVKVLTQYKGEITDISVERNIIIFVREEELKLSNKGVAIDDITFK